jgi:hypothetical protein
MSDLVKRARHNANADMPHYASVELIEAMADRIEQLEAKLAKAVEAERERCAKVAESVALPMDGRNAKAQADYMSKVIASAIRADLKGQDDECRHDNR